MTTTHKADGLYDFCLDYLRERGVYACDYGREQFKRAVWRHTGRRCEDTTKVVITIDFMETLDRYFDGASQWFAMRMYNRSLITERDWRLCIGQSDATQARLQLMNALYNRATREGLITA